MAKVRVIEAAKEHGLDVEELLGTLKQMGVKVRSHLSPVDQEEADQAIASLTKKKPAAATPTAEEPKAPRMVRRRKKEAEPELETEPETEATTEPEVAQEEVAGGEPAPDDEPISEEAATGEPSPEETVIEEAISEEASGEEASEEQQPAADEAAPEEAKTKAPGKGKKAGDKAEAKKGKAGAKDEQKDEEFGLKVVRFIQPEDRPATFAKPAYPVSKQEREQRKAERRAKKKKGRREDHRSAPRRAGQKTQITTPKAIKRRIKISEIITVGDLAKRMGVKAPEVIKTLMGLGIMSTINQPLDADTATLVAGEFEYEIENIILAEEEILQRHEDKPEDLKPRAPVVTVMGHVDHGKTSLLDAIRTTRVAAGESGGITQHIGAYKVETSRGTLVFLDTPGHAAFTEMRARGAQVTDIVVLVVAANDGVMPQTIEAIHHAEAAGVPIIVAVNKMDLPDAQPDKVKRELSENNLIPEDWGGDVICVPVSAKQGDGIENLLEMIALQSEMLEITANPDKQAAGVVVEARLDKGRGPVSTVLVQEGTLNLGDIVLSGTQFGRVRILTNDTGKRVEIAEPGTPVEITGLDGVPEAGDVFVVVDTERTAKEITSRRLEKTRDAEMAKARKVSLEDWHDHVVEGETQSLRLIVKGDVQGSVEAVAQTLENLSVDEVNVQVIHKAAGGITESDVNLAIASRAIIIGFHVRCEAKAAALASQTGIDIRLYDVIYDATDSVKKAMSGLLAPVLQENKLGMAEVRQTFRVPKVGTVAGCYIREGLATRNSKVRLIRDNIVIYEGELSSLKRFKDDAKEVREGLECGLSILNYNDIKDGDEIEFYEIEEIAQTL
jgi:translation initiation factor IF-2